jgi:hypothetical protein
VAELEVLVSKLGATAQWNKKEKKNEKVNEWCFWGVISSFLFFALEKKNCLGACRQNFSKLTKLTCHLCRCGW